MQTNGHFHFSSYSFYCLLLENLSSFGLFWIFSYPGILFTSYSAIFFLIFIQPINITTIQRPILCHFLLLCFILYDYNYILCANVYDESESEMKSLSHVRLFATPWTVASRLLCPWNFPGKSTGVGLPFPSSGDLPDPGIKPRSPTLQADALPSEPPRKHISRLSLSYNIRVHNNHYIRIF